MLDLLEGWNDSGKFQFDLSRIYSTGQSMGSMESQQFAQETPDYYAAVASTSFYQDYPDAHSDKPIPTYLINGEGNGKDDTGTPYDDRWNRTDDWAQYFLRVNGFVYTPAVYAADGTVTTFGVPVSELFSPSQAPMTVSRPIPGSWTGTFPWSSTPIQLVPPPPLAMTSG